MHQKDAVKEAWRAAGLYESRDAKLQAFMKRIDNPEECWPELIDECRRHYPEYKAQLVNPIMERGDKLLRLNLIRAADPQYPDELALIRQFVKRSDPESDIAELRAIALRDEPDFEKALTAKRRLPQDLKEMLAEKAKRPAAPRPPVERAARPPRDRQQPKL